jgi:hypothetical protein
MRAGDPTPAEAATKRTEIIETNTKGLKRKGCWVNNVINLCGLLSFSTTLYCRGFSYFFCFSFLFPTADCVDKSFDDVYCSTWSGIIEGDMFIQEDIWNNSIQKGSVTFLGFIRLCYWLLSYEWLEMKSFTWEDIRRQTAMTSIGSAFVMRIFALLVGVARQ